MLAMNVLRRSKFLDMVRRRAVVAGVFDPDCCHAVRATSSTTQREHGETIELYDRTSDQMTLVKVERIFL